MLQQLKKRNSGFTIIEVLIVLAIAGLIMVVVFLAVPNLQRNQRNNQTKTEANNILAAYSEVSNNKGGDTLVNSVSSTNPSDAYSVMQAANLKTFTAVNIVSGTAGTAVTGHSTTVAVIATGVRCTAQNSATPAVSQSTRQAAVFYKIEASGGSTVDQCINT